MLHDLRLAWRSLTRRRPFLAAAMTTPGIGIGLNTALFSVITALLLEPQPVRNGGSLVWIASAVGSVSILAAHLPVRRAASVDPVVALRSE